MKDALTKANLPLADARPRRQRQGRRRQDAGHDGRQHRRSRTISPTWPPRSCCRCSRRATSRSCWCSGRAIPTAASTTRATASNTVDARHQRPDLDGRHQERRRQSRAAAQGAGRARARRDDRHHRLRRPWLLDDLEGEQDQPRGQGSYDDMPRDFLPIGFLALDLAKALDLPLFDPERQERCASAKARIPRPATAVLGKDPAKPELVVAANGGSDLIYLPNNGQGARRRAASRRCWRRTMSAGSSSIDALGRFPGTLPMSRDQPEGQGGDADAVDRRQFPHLRRRAATSRPTARSRSPTPGCSRARACTAASAAPTP